MDEDNDRFPLHTAARERNVTKAEGLLRVRRTATAPRPRLVEAAPADGSCPRPTRASRGADDGRCAIHWAASSNCLDMVVLLANQRGFDPDVQDASGWTPLMIAASVPDGEPVVGLLLRRGADVNETNGSGQTALHFVASKKKLDVARLLLERKPPASTRVRDRRGQYPVHRAAAAGSVPMLSLLLRNRSPLNPADNEGYTPLHHAVAEGHGDAAVALLKEGADFTIKNGDELALDLAPDKEVRRYIMQGAEREGIDLSPSHET